MKMILKIFLLSILLSLSLTFTSCRTDCHEWDDYKFNIEFKDSYNPNEDINLTISLGLNPNYDYYKTNNSKVVLAYSKEKEFNDDNVNILYSIIDFSNEDYYFTKRGEKIKYNFTEEVVINKEYFIDGSGEITFMMYPTYGKYSESHSSSISIKYKYEIRENRLYFTHSK